MAEDKKAPVHATHRIDIECYIHVDTDEQAQEVARYIQVFLNGVPEVIRADMTNKE